MSKLISSSLCLTYVHLMSCIACIIEVSGVQENIIKETNKDLYFSMITMKWFSNAKDSP